MSSGGAYPFFSSSAGILVPLDQMLASTYFVLLLLLWLVFRAPSACLSFTRGMWKGCVAAVGTALRQAKWEDSFILAQVCVCAERGGYP